jgi:hypothetical protein
MDFFSNAQEAFLCMGGNVIIRMKPSERYARAFAYRYLCLQFVTKLGLAIDGYMALVTYIHRHSSEDLEPLPHAYASAISFLVVNAVDMVAHMHRPYSYTMLHHVVAMVGCALCISAGGFAPSIIRLTLLLEVVGPWYKALSLANQFGVPKTGRLSRCLSVGAIACNVGVRFPFVLWLACTLMGHLHKTMTFPEATTSVNIWLWGILVAYCPLTVYVDSKWTERLIHSF